MKLLIKSLAGGNFHLEAEPTDTIGAIKSKIQAEQGHAPELQKIIFSGKILTDDKTVADCKIKEKDFLVVMVSKPKVAKPAPAAASTATPSEPSASKDASQKTEGAQSSEPSAASATSTTNAAADSATQAQPKSDSTSSATETPSSQASAPGSGSGSFLTGSHLESAMQSMMEMGFEREQVQRAMRAAFNNPDRAVEYLMTGIPEHLSQREPQAESQAPATQPQQTPSSNTATGANPQTPAAPTSAAAGGNLPTTPATPTPASRAGNLFEAAAAAQAQGGRRGGAGGGAGAGGELLGEDDGSGEQVIDLGNPAMLAQLQQLVQQNPAALQPLVQAIAQSNPRLAEAMNQDPQGVLALLAGGAAGGAGLGGGDEMELPTLAELSPEDRTSVEQIVAMGIPEAKAIESYFMCGKNVEMAVQYYFENPQDFED